jgi:hypothetical protein
MLKLPMKLLRFKEVVCVLLLPFINCCNVLGPPFFEQANHACVEVPEETQIGHFWAEGDCLGRFPVDPQVHGERVTSST